MRGVKLVSILMAGSLLWGSLLPQQGITHENAKLEALYFSPNNGVMNSLINLMDQEKKSIRMAAYCLMHTGVAKALKKAQTRGVFVEVVVDSFSVKSRSPLVSMVKAGVPVYVWSCQERKGIMHHKFCVFGGERVWTGSCNFTKQGDENNRENVLVLNGTDIANAFLQQFEAIKKEECVPYADFVSRRQKTGG